MALYANGLIEWGGGAGQPVYVRQPDGSMKNVGAPEHGESASYVSRAVSDPQVEKVIALYNAAPEMLNNEQKAFISAGMGGLDSYGQGYRWGAQNLFDNKFDPQQAGHLLQSGFANYLSPADISSGQQFNYEQSPSQQSARDDDGGMFGDLAPLLLAGAGLYFGMPYLSEAIGGAGMLGSEAVGGLYGLELGGAGVGAADLGLGYGATAGAAGLGTYNAGAVMDAAGMAGSGTYNAGAVMDAAGLAGSGAYNAGAVMDAAGAAGAGSTASNLFGIPGLTTGNILSGGASILGGVLSGQAGADAANTSANAQLEAARIAADAAKFRPVGVTTRFGQSQFQKDANGNVIGAGYALSPDIKAQQDALLAGATGMLPQYAASQAATAPMGTAANRMMSLGNQYLATDPQAQALKYMQDQQALLATGRERDLSNTMTGEFNRGTYGLATGGTSTGMQAANPRLEAMFNAQRQQDLGLAAQATQGGQQYATFGSGLVGAGGDMLKGMYGTQAASLQPWQTGMNAAQYLEGLGQQPLTLGMDIGRQVTSGTAAGGNLLAQGMLGAAQTQQQAAYSPWGTALMAGGNALSSMQAQQAQQQQQQAVNDAMISRLWR